MTGQQFLKITGICRRTCTRKELLKVVIGLEKVNYYNCTSLLAN